MTPMGAKLRGASVLGLALASGCAHYVSRSLSAKHSIAVFNARSLADPGLRAFLAEYQICVPHASSTRRANRRSRSRSSPGDRRASGSGLRPELAASRGQRVAAGLEPAVDRPHSCGWIAAVRGKQCRGRKYAAIDVRCVTYILVYTFTEVASKWLSRRH